MHTRLRRAQAASQEGECEPPVRCQIPPQPQPATRSTRVGAVEQSNFSRACATDNNHLKQELLCTNFPSASLFCQCASGFSSHFGGSDGAGLPAGLERWIYLLMTSLDAALCYGDQAPELAEGAVGSPADTMRV